MRRGVEGSGGVVGNGRRGGLAGRTREGRGGNCRALSSRDGTGVGVSIRCRDTRRAGSPDPGPGRSSPGLSGIADLCGPRLEGLGPDREPQISGESPLAVTCVPPLPCPVTCSSGPGCVHRRLLSIPMYDGLARMFRARPGFSRLFSALRSSRQSGSGIVRPGRCGPRLPGRHARCSTRHIAFSRRNRTGPAGNPGSGLIPGGFPARRRDPAASGERPPPPLDSAPGTFPSRACERALARASGP